MKRTVITLSSIIVVLVITVIVLSTRGSGGDDSKVVRTDTSTTQVEPGTPVTPRGTDNNSTSDSPSDAEIQAETDENWENTKTKLKETASDLNNKIPTEIKDKAKTAKDWVKEHANSDDIGTVLGDVASKISDTMDTAVEQYKAKQAEGN